MTVPGEMIPRQSWARHEKVGSTDSEGQTAELFRSHPSGNERQVEGSSSNELTEHMARLFAAIPQDDRRSARPADRHPWRRLWDDLSSRTERTFIHPGSNTDIDHDPDRPVDQRSTGLVLSISRQLLQICQAADGVAASIKLGDEDIWAGQVKPGDVVRINLPAKAGDLHLEVDKRREPSCDHFTVAFEFSK